MNQHLNRFGLAYLKGLALLIAQMAASYVAAVNSISPAQWAAMDRLHKSGFFVGIIGGGAILVAAFLSQAISAAKAAPAPVKPALLPAGAVAMLLGVLCLGALSGCAGQTIAAATTTYQVRDAQGKTTSIAFPKELTSTNLHVAIDPATSNVLLTADSYKSSSSQIIDSAATAQANAFSSLASIISQLLPLAAKAAGVPLATPAPAAPAPPPAQPPPVSVQLAAPAPAPLVVPKVAVL